MRILFFMVLLAILIGCKFKNESTETPQYTLAPVKDSKNLYLTTQEFIGVIIAPDTLDPTEENAQFMPSVEDVFKAERILKKCLDSTQIDSTMILAPSEYIRQYIGHRNKQGETIILLNCFTRRSVSNPDYWKKDIIVITDGGNNYFSLQVNLTKGDCSNFTVNRK